MKKKDRKYTEILILYNVMKLRALLVAETVRPAVNAQD